MNSQSPILLVHGAWFGGWCWNRVVSALVERQRHVVAVDLPGRPGNPCPLEAVTLESWVHHLRSVIEGFDQPVFLVAHSLGGVAATGVAEAIPSLVSAAAFVSAFLLQDGQSAVDILRGDPGTLVRQARELTPDGRASHVDPREVRDILCNGCSDQDAALLARYLVPETTRIARSPVHWTKGGFGSVTRHYIGCTEDRVISIESQRAMYRASNCSKVAELDTGHAPFFTRPERLAELIDELSC